MKQSLNGTKWLCVDGNMEENGWKCTVIDGAIDPDWHGENDIEIQYENGQEAYMKLRKFMQRFLKID